MFNVTQVGSWPRSEKRLRALNDREKGGIMRVEFDRIADDEVCRSGAARGRDNGAFGPQDIHARMYYSAFIHDPHGINIEAVWLRSE